MNAVSLFTGLAGMDEPRPDELCRDAFNSGYNVRRKPRGYNEQCRTIVARAPHQPLHPCSAPQTRTVKPDGEVVWQITDPKNTRRFSYPECARLQGLGDIRFPPGSMRKKYEVVGNAVPPPLMRAVLETLWQPLTARWAA